MNTPPNRVTVQLERYEVQMILGSLEAQAEQWNRRAKAPAYAKDRDLTVIIAGSLDTLAKNLRSRINGNGNSHSASPRIEAGADEQPQRKRRKMSKEARKRIAEAQRQRWAAHRAAAEQETQAINKKRKKAA